MKKNRLILASSSPQRKRILKKMGIAFRAVPGNVAEDFGRMKRPHAISMRLAWKKAKSVSERYPDAWVLGVDTLVVLPDGTISGKPMNREEAEQILRQYKNAHCDVYSGVALLKKGRGFCDYEKTRLYFRDIAEKEIRTYLDRNEWRGSSGAMTIEGGAGEWIRRMEGDYWNVVGLGVFALRKIRALD